MKHNPRAKARGIRRAQLCTKTLGACEAGVMRKAWGVSPRVKLRAVARIHGLLITTLLIPGADAPGSTLHACFAGSKTFAKPNARLVSEAE